MFCKSNHQICGSKLAKNSDKLLAKPLRWMTNALILWENRSFFIRIKFWFKWEKKHRKSSEIFVIKHWYDVHDDDVCSVAFPRKIQYEPTNNEGNGSTKYNFCILKNYYCYALVDYKIINRLESGLCRSNMCTSAILSIFLLFALPKTWSSAAIDSFCSLQR